MISYFENLTNLQKNLVIAIMAVVIYSVSASISYLVFSSINKVAKFGLTATLPTPEAITGEDPTEPKTETCPLNGEARTKKAREFWEKRIPLAVMVENHVESRPQSGLSSADIIYEAVAEGGITRLLAIFYCNPGDFQVGPVRSARTYFLDWVSEYDGLYAHVGGANTPGPANALGQIIDYKIKDLNQFSIGFPTFWRDYQRLGHPVATEHTMYSTTHKLWAVAEKRGWDVASSEGDKWDKDFVPFKFSAKANTDTSLQAATKIEVNFWGNQPDYSVLWEFDSSCNCYKRKNGGTDHTDLNNKQQLAPKNVVIQLEQESHANDGYEGNVHLLYKTIGSGKALIFKEGKVIVGKWVKSSRKARTKFTDEKGVEVELTVGQIWIQTVPEGASIKY